MRNVWLIPRLLNGSRSRHRLSLGCTGEFYNMNENQMCKITSTWSRSRWVLSRPRHRASPRVKLFWAVRLLSQFRSTPARLLYASGGVLLAMMAPMGYGPP